MAKMTRNDFTFYKDYGTQMHSFHEERFTDIINPALVLRYYEGCRSVDIPDIIEDDRSEPDRIKLNKFFPSTNTLLAELYPINPKWIITDRRNTMHDKLSAKVLEGSLDYYYQKINAKRENQKAILNAWFFGFGATKQGWHTDIRPVSSPLPSYGLGDKVKSFMTGKKPEYPDIEYYIEEEGPFIRSISPCDLELDHKKSFDDPRIIKHRITRTLKEVIDCPLYKGATDQDFKNYFTKATDDTRKIEVTLNEMWIKQKDGIWVFTYMDNWAKPLRWQKWGSLQEGFPITLLRLNDEPQVTYPVSHFKVAQRNQREIDFVMSKWVENVSRFKSLMYVNLDKFGSNKQQAKNVLSQNPIGGILYGKGSLTGGDMVNISNETLPRDAFGLLEVLQSNLQEILSITGAKQTGEADTETATEAKIAESGNILRTTGMRGYIKDFIIEQGKKMAQNLKQFANTPEIIKITGLDLMNPETGQLITDEWVSFGQFGEMSLKEAIQGDFDFDIDFTEALPKDLPVIRKQMMEVGQLLMQAQPLLAQEGKKFEITEWVKDMLENFEAVATADKYITDVSPQGQMSGVIPQEQIPPAPGASLGGGLPTAQSINRAATQVPVGEGIGGIG